MRTSLPEDQARQVAGDLETTRAAMLRVAWGGSDGPSRRSEVVVFSRGTQFDTFVNSYVAGETLMPPGFERMIVFSRNTTLGMSSLAAHELAHDLTAWNMPLQPPWLAEGLAQYLETVRFGKKTNTVYLGVPSDNSLRALGVSRAIDSERLFGVGWAKELSYSWRNELYGQSWLLVRYLIEEQSEPFADFQQRVAHLADWRSAFDSIMPAGVTPGPQLDRKLNEYWASHRQWLFTVAAPMDPVQFRGDVRPLSPAAVHGLFSWLLPPSEMPRMRAEVNAALKLDPGELDALRSSFYVLARSAAERSELALRASASNPNSAEAWVMVADAAGQNAAAQRPALERAVKLDPENPRVLARLGILAQLSGDYRRALKDLRFSMRFALPTQQVLSAYITALGRVHHCSEARQIAESQLPGFTPAMLQRLRESYAAIEDCRAPAKSG